MRIVPSFDELKNGLACFGWGVEAGTVEQFAFECGEEGFTHGIIEAIADGTHRRADPGFPAAVAEGNRRVLAALIGVMDDIMSLSHQAGHPLAPHMQVFFCQFGVDARRTIGAFRFLVDLLDRLGQHLVILYSFGRRSLQPGIEPTGRDFQDLAHAPDRIGSLVLAHELEDYGGIESVSRTSQAAAFPAGAWGRCARISCSSRNCLLSLRRRASSALSSLVRPSCRFPRSSSSCLIQLCGWLKIPRQIFRAPPRSGQFQDLLAVFLRIGCMGSGHFFAPSPKLTTVHLIGSTPLSCSLFRANMSVLQVSHYVTGCCFASLPQGVTTLRHSRSPGHIGCLLSGSLTFPRTGLSPVGRR
jgi:hypothetical protein